MYTEEGKNHFTVRDNVLGHSQQGGTPSSFDRNMSTKLAAKTVSWLTEQLDHFASRDGINHWHLHFLMNENWNGYLRNSSCRDPRICSHSWFKTSFICFPTCSGTSQADWLWEKVLRRLNILVYNCCQCMDLQQFISGFLSNRDGGWSWAKLMMF